MTVGGTNNSPALAGWLMIPTPICVEAAGRAGFDWIGLDLQHGAWDLGSAYRAIQLLDALNVPVLVRLSEDDLPQIPKVLDHGAAGIVVAMVSSPEIVKDAIDRARYQPEGRRSYGAQRYGMRAEPEQVADVRPSIYAMIEDRRGFDQVADIAAVDGLAGLHVGPVDLGLGLGIAADSEAFGEALGSIVAAGRAAGISVTMHCVDGANAAAMLGLGFDQFVLPSDITLFRGAMARELNAVRDAVATDGA